MATNVRTGEAVAKLVDAIKEDFKRVTAHLREARALIGELESDAKGINGLSAFLKAQGNTLDKMADDLDAEAIAVEKKMVAPMAKEPVTIIHGEHAEKVRAAKLMDAESS